MTLNELNERVTSIEAVTHELATLTKELTEIAKSHDAILKRMDARIEIMDVRLEEARRDNAQTQRLWVRLCRKHGWLEDEDLEGYDRR